MIAEAKRQLDFASRSFEVHNGRSKNEKVKVPLELPRYVCTFIEILAQNTSLKKFQTFSNTSNSALHLSIPLSPFRLLYLERKLGRDSATGTFHRPLYSSSSSSRLCFFYELPASIYAWSCIKGLPKVSISRLIDVTGSRSNSKYREPTSHLAIVLHLYYVSGNSAFRIAFRVKRSMTRFYTPNFSYSN